MVAFLDQLKNKPEGKNRCETHSSSKKITNENLPQLSLVDVDWSNRTPFKTKKEQINKIVNVFMLIYLKGLFFSILLWAASVSCPCIKAMCKRVFLTAASKSKYINGRWKPLWKWWSHLLSDFDFYSQKTDGRKLRFFHCSSKNILIKQIKQFLYKYIIECPPNVFLNMKCSVNYL